MKIQERLSAFSMRLKTLTMIQLLPNPRYWCWTSYRWENDAASSSSRNKTCIKRKARKLSKIVFNISPGTQNPLWMKITSIFFNLREAKQNQVDRVQVASECEFDPSYQLGLRQKLGLERRERKSQIKGWGKKERNKLRNGKFCSVNKTITLWRLLSPSSWPLVHS